MRPDQLAREMMKIPDLDAKIRGETEDYITVVDEIAQALKTAEQEEDEKVFKDAQKEKSDTLSSGFAVLEKFNDELGYLKQLHPAWAKKDDEREYFSFATKFCSHHDPSGKLFPIYDQFVADRECPEFCVGVISSHHFLEEHAYGAPNQTQGVSGFLCLGRLFQGQPNEAALCI